MVSDKRHFQREPRDNGLSMNDVLFRADGSFYDFVYVFREAK
jgi:hypothetical protein